MQTTRNWLSGGLLTILGVLAFGTGVYFLAIRPTFLPEDIRFTGIDEATLPQAFLDWLGIVFLKFDTSLPISSGWAPPAVIRFNHLARLEGPNRRNRVVSRLFRFLP